VGIVARRSTDFFAVDDEVVRRALRFMDANFHEPLSVDAVANAVSVSRRTLENRFRNKLGRTVAGEIQRLQVGWVLLHTRFMEPQAMDAVEGMLRRAGALERIEDPAGIIAYRY
jgi:transcriptional regulator GlxA family with amidase domain